ncbi:calcium-binding and coiled-coil domain-containing protein 2 [Nycticebus coucang]|uniref:calcium-binding and coiled-coil domain-containing protein 2 n=1 Tax=Nycticebus coucang TaxID=9470 RepID=UPI00234CE5C4|nr:calcium-binding and coiled-coil domain-containing protein 2 [Nycticebus coucang]XP_053426100.1 calcium-binding and coiled-coil domain-containing protein 2 [Nycticebus coucang]XP_053426101.1 calcium-binding and coiled-coil domain-containing protein 2 [Nycticebus coucang]
MENIMEDPPTSAVLLEHCHFSQVIFNNVEKFYVPGGDITCFYTLTQHFIPRRKDWIGIFRVGWKTTREYYTFMWVTLPVDMNNESAKQEVQFKAYYLPKDDEYYQFCYVDQDGVVRGASIPFQFRPENEEDILVVTTQGEVEEIEEQNKELCKENQELKDSCVSLQKQNSDMQAELQRKQEELETLQSINKKLEQKVKEQKDCWETELLQLKEQNQKVSLENEKMGIRVDQLQVQLSTQEKEMEQLIQGAQDKTEQLEHLKKENGQLFLTLTEQREQQKKLEQTVEEMKQKETTTLKNQQELMDENFDLSRRLSENKIIYDAQQREKERIEKENDLLKKENNRLLCYMGLDFDSLLHHVPTSEQGGAKQNAGLAYGNPYSGIQESSSLSLLATEKCPTCNSDFANGICDHILEQQQMQTHCLNCPICDKVFPAREVQIFEDHVFCHSL